MKTPMTSGIKTLDEWIELYEKRTGHKYLLSEGEQVFYSPETGFFTYWFDHKDKLLVVPKMCGDGKKMREILSEMMKALGNFGFFNVYACSRVRPAVYIRANRSTEYNVEHVRTEEEDGRPLYYFLWEWRHKKEDEKI